MNEELSTKLDALGEEIEVIRADIKDGKSAAEECESAIIRSKELAEEADGHNDDTKNELCNISNRIDTISKLYLEIQAYCEGEETSEEVITITQAVAKHGHMVQADMQQGMSVEETAENLGLSTTLVAVIRERVRNIDYSEETEEA